MFVAKLLYLEWKKIKGKQKGRKEIERKGEKEEEERKKERKEGKKENDKEENEGGKNTKRKERKEAINKADGKKKGRESGRRKERFQIYRKMDTWDDLFSHSDILHMVLNEIKPYATICINIVQETWYDIAFTTIKKWKQTIEYYKLVNNIKNIKITFIV